MIIFLHGSESFMSRQKLNAIIDQFKKTRDQHGDSVVHLDGNKLTLDELNSKLASQSLLAEKRMVIVNDLFNQKEKTVFKSLLEYLQKLAETKNENAVIFYESRELDPKKFGEKKLLVDQKKLFDFLVKQKFSEKFNQLNNLQLTNWIQTKTTGKNINISSPMTNLLITLVGNDLWLVNNELNKIINFVQANKQNEITEQDIRQFARGNIDENIFALTDAVSNKNQALFFSLLENQIESGTSIQQILTMLLRQFKIILQIKNMLVQNQQQNIASKLRLHPFVVQKTTPQTRNFSLDYLKNTLDQLTQIDYKIKTGQADGLTSLNILFSQ